MHSTIIRWFEDEIGIDKVSDRIAYLAFFGVVSTLFSLLFLVGMAHLSGWWSLTGIALVTLPYTVGLAEALIRLPFAFGAKVAGRIANSIRSIRSKVRRNRIERATAKLWKGEIDNNRVEPYLTNVAAFSDAPFTEACTEFFRDQLGRSLEPSETVTVLKQEVCSENEAMVLATLTRRSRTANGAGAVKDTFQSVTVGIRFKLFVDQKVMIPEFVMSFPTLIPTKRMWSMFKDAVDMRRSADTSLDSVYDEGRRVVTTAEAVTPSQRRQQLKVTS
jgi:hypothetical protein